MCLCDPSKRKKNISTSNSCKFIAIVTNDKLIITSDVKLYCNLNSNLKLDMTIGWDT